MYEPGLASTKTIGKKSSKLDRSRTRSGILFAFPWIIGFLAFSLYPICVSFYYSLTEFNLFKEPKWVGLSNYTALFSDEKFFKSLWNTFYMVIIGTPVSLVVALLLAVLLNQKIRGLPVFRTIFYLPSIVPTVAASLLWLWILNPKVGVLNSLLGYLGMPKPNWLMDPNWTKPALILIGIWGVGNMMIIFLASLQDVPRSLYEAAEMDGANTIQKFFRITLPSVSPVIFFQLIMNIIYYFQYFTQAYLIINGSSTGSGLNDATGGVENSMLFYSLYLFHNAFSFFKMGKASAMAWILFIIVVAVTAIIFKTQDRWVTYGDE
jgi:multiple sugar transport system permease protein